MRFTFLFISICLISLGCAKDKVPTSEIPDANKWQAISGQYKVYDTLGAFLYNMNILHVPSDFPQNGDSLKFENFDGEFTFTVQQSTSLNIPETFIQIGYHDTLYDSNSKRWKILTNNDIIYNNVLINDTIRISFRKTNINYWLEDLVPYYSCVCKQIAVKQ